MKFEKNPAFPNATPNQIMDQLRLWRNKELQDSDWRMIPDTPFDKESWANYRQALRDLPAQSDNAEEIELPLKPSI